MTLTMTELEAVTAEVSEALTGGVVRGLAVPAPDRAVLTVERGGELRRVLFCVRPGVARMHLTTMRLDRPPEAVPAFARPARRELLGATVDGVHTRYGDRVVALELSTPAGHRTLLFEGSGHHPNLFVLGPDGRILLMLAPSRSHRRDLRPGARYQRPLPHPAGVGACRFMGMSGSVSAEVEAFYGAEEARPGRPPAHRRTAPARLPPSAGSTRGGKSPPLV